VIFTLSEQNMTGDACYRKFSQMFYLCLFMRKAKIVSGVVYYAFWDMTFLVVCKMAVCECKMSAKFQSTDKWCPKRKKILNCLKRVVSNSSLTFGSNLRRFVINLQNVSLCLHVVNMLRRCWFLFWERQIHFAWTSQGWAE